MDWLKELLKGLENAEKLEKAIAKGIGENFVSKADFNAANESKKQLEKDIAERDKQLEELKKIDAAGLKAEIEKLQGENKAAKEKYEADMKDLTLTNAIKLAVAGQAYDEGLVAGLVDKTKLILGDDGKVTGLEEQVKSLKESKAFLFKEKDPDGTGGSKGNGGKGKPGEKNPWSKEHFNLTEQGKILRENPELAAQLKAAAAK